MSVATDLLDELKAIRSALERPAVPPLAVDAGTLAGMLSVSPRSIWALCAAGKLPEPIRLGGRSVWRLADIEKRIAGWKDRGRLRPGRKPKAAADGEEGAGPAAEGELA